MVGGIIIYLFRDPGTPGNESPQSQKKAHESPQYTYGNTGEVGVKLLTFQVTTELLPTGVRRKTSLGVGELLKKISCHCPIKSPLNFQFLRGMIRLSEDEPQAVLPSTYEVRVKVADASSLQYLGLTLPSHVKVEPRV